MISAVQCRFTIEPISRDRYAIAFMQHGLPLGKDLGPAQEGYSEQEIKAHLIDAMVPSEEIRQRIRMARSLRDAMIERGDDAAPVTRSTELVRSRPDVREACGILVGIIVGCLMWVSGVALTMHWLGRVS